MTGARAGTAASALRRQRGAVPVEWALGVAVLILPVAMLVAVLPAWAERQSMVRLAAREAARVAVMAEDPAKGESAGTALALDIAANHGVAAGEAAVSVVVPVDATGAPARDGVVTARVEVSVPLAALPGLGTVGGWRIAATHHEPVDRYRSHEP